MPRGRVHSIFIGGDEQRMVSVLLCLWCPWWSPWLVNGDMEWPLPRQVSGRGDLIVTKGCRFGVCHSLTGSPVRQNRSVARGGKESPRESPQGWVDLEQSRHASLGTTTTANSTPCLDNAHGN